MNKFLAIAFVMGLPALIFAKEARIVRLKKVNKSKPMISKPRSGNVDIFKKMLKQNEQIAMLLARRSNLPYIWEGDKKILTGRVFKGTLMNSISSTNLASPVLIKADAGQALPVNSKFSCFGTTIHKRVQVVCNKLVTAQRELNINALALNIDGSSGLLGRYDDAGEELVAAAVMSDIGNTLLPLTNSGQAVSKAIQDELKTQGPVVTIDAGTRVLIYFKEAMSEV